MKILTKQRLMAASKSFSLDDFLKYTYERDGIRYDVISEIVKYIYVKDKAISSSQLTKYFLPYFDQCAINCIQANGFITGNIQYDVQYITYTDIVANIIESLVSENAVNYPKELAKSWADFCYKKYKDYILPVSDEDYFQVYDEFKDYDKQQFMSRQEYRDYVLSKGFGNKAKYN